MLRTRDLLGALKRLGPDPKGARWTLPFLDLAVHHLLVIIPWTRLVLLSYKDCWVQDKRRHTGRALRHRLQPLLDD